MEDVTVEALSRWAKLDHPTLIAEIGEAVRELFQLYLDLGDMESQEAKAKVYGYANSQAESIAQRDRDAAAEALPARMSSIETRARIQALEAAREFGYVLLEHRSA